MKFLQTFSALLCALSLGVSAVPTAGSSSALEIRATTETPEYKKAHAAHPDIQVGETYAFTLKSPKSAGEKDPKMKKLTDELGFSHIYLVVGQVSESSSGPPKKPTGTEKKFTGVMYHMAGIDTVVADFKNWKADEKTLEFVKETTEAKSGRLSKIGRFIFK